MRTVEPTLRSAATFRQGWGTFDNLVTALQLTGTLAGSNGGKVGYAFAYGVQGQDGPFHHARFYQPAAAWDQSAPIGSPGYNLGIYEDATSNSLRTGRFQFRL